jgi:hypothetical protein
MLTQSQSMSLIVRKPSNRTDAVDVVLHASGESAFSASYGLMMQRTPAQPGQNSSFGQWWQLDQQKLSLDGHHIIWKAPPAEDTQLALSKEAGRFSASKLFSFQIVLNCSAEERCVQDGDEVQTVVQTGSSSQPEGMRSEIIIVARVESVISCDRSEAWIQGKRSGERLQDSSVAETFPIVVRLVASDVDGFPIAQHQVSVEFSWDGTKFAHEWAGRGSNEYSAALPPSLSKQAGDYELVVTAFDAYQHKTGHTARCVLLRQTLHVKSDNVQVYIAAGLAGVLVLTLGVLVYLLIKNRSRARKLLLSFLSFEGVLVHLH